MIKYNLVFQEKYELGGGGAWDEMQWTNARGDGRKNVG